MKLSISLFAIILATTILFFSCKTQIENTTPQIDSLQKIIIEKEHSTINLPIEIPISALENEINKQFDGLIYEDVSYDKPEKDDVMVRIWKTRNIKIIGYNEFLKFDTPVKIWASYRWQACDICPKIEKETNFEIVVSFTTKLKVNPDWKFETQTVPSGLVFESKPKLDFGLVSIPITSIVEPIVKEQLSEVTKEIDKEVAGNFDFSKEIDSVWRELHNPQLIDSTYNVWLKMTPAEVFLSPIKGNNERVKIAVGFKGFFEIIIGNKPQNTRYNKLPQIKTSDNQDKDFNFFIESFIDFESASQIARRHLKDTILEITAGKSIKIDDISFIGLGNKVFTKVDLSKSINGSIFFIGTPAYDYSTNLIYFKDFDYDLRTKNALLKSANWLLHGALKSKIEKEFNYSLADDLKTIRSSVSNLLSNYEFDNLFTLNGKLEHLDIKEIIVEDNGLRVIINSKGKANIKIKSLSF